LTYSPWFARRDSATWLVAASLLLATLACQIDLGGPAAPYVPIPPDPGGADEVLQTWQAALAEAAETQQVMILLDERQLTAYLSDRLEAREEPLLSDAQVFLRQDTIEVYGIAERGLLKAGVMISIQPVLEDDGRVAFRLAEATLGPLPAPKALKDSISAILTEAFTGTLGSLATGIRVTSLAVADGQMAIVGELR